MRNNKVVRRVLPHVHDFKAVWKNEGPFRYALTSRVFPFILLEEEEWLFADDSVLLLKELMQWDRRKMKMIKAPVAQKTNEEILFDRLSRWRIQNFPQEWADLMCDFFTPSGQIAEKVLPENGVEKPDEMEACFFAHLSKRVDDIGYLLLEPAPGMDPDAAYVQDYVKEWEDDERDAGLI